MRAAAVLALFLAACTPDRPGSLPEAQEEGGEEVAPSQAATVATPPDSASPGAPARYAATDSIPDGDAPAAAAPAIPERPFAAPTGPHPVGVFERRWTVAGRPERFTRNPDDERSVAVRIWYPAALDAAPPDSSSGAPYLPDMAEFGDGQEFLPVTHVRTHAIATATAATGPFPVLLYNHGGGWTRFTSTFTTEELASHGYVVVSVGHNGFNRTQFLPDGASVIPDTLTFPEPGGDLYNDAIQGWDFLDEHVFPEWVADAVFALDRLEGLNRDGPLAGRLDLERIGAWGWSFGGATAIELAVIDERVRAAIDHDGQLFGEAPARGTGRPFMLLHGGTAAEPPPFEEPDSAAAWNDALERLMAEVRATDARLKAASTGDRYDFRIAGTNHGSFSDLVLFLPGSSPGIDPARGHLIVNALTVAFFGRYLKGEDAPLLDDPGAVFPEVTPSGPPPDP